MPRTSSTSFFSFQSHQYCFYPFTWLFFSCYFNLCFTLSQAVGEGLPKAYAPFQIQVPLHPEIPSIVVIIVVIIIIQTSSKIHSIQSANWIFYVCSTCVSKKISPVCHVPPFFGSSDQRAYDWDSSTTQNTMQSHRPSKRKYRKENIFFLSLKFFLGIL